MNFPSGVILLVFIINTKEIRSLCVLTLLCYGNIELYFENCPLFIWNCPWFMSNSHEPGAILKCKLSLVYACLFQGLPIPSHTCDAAQAAIPHPYRPMIDNVFGLGVLSEFATVVGLYCEIKW